MQCVFDVGLFPKELSWRGRSMELLLAYLHPDPAASGLILGNAIIFHRNDLSLLGNNAFNSWRGLINLFGASSAI